MTVPSSADLKAATESIQHYENFPVGSWLVPSLKRPYVHSIYRFARFADDIADEGVFPKSYRVLQLTALREALGKINDSPSIDLPPVVAHLKDQLQNNVHLYLPYLDNLLDAFIQDSNNSSDDPKIPAYMFENESDLLSYCVRSANPVGRMMLHVFDCHEPNNLPLADSICSGLQWVNFMQDVSLDAQKGRIYIPKDAFPGTCAMPTAEMIKAQTLKARSLLIAGIPLMKRVPLRLALELRAIIAGGLTLADKILAVGGDTVNARPSLSLIDAWRLASRFLSPR
jgi:squalene synthase HpnC